jgi:uncharacterized membrane protein
LIVRGLGSLSMVVVIGLMVVSLPASGSTYSIAQESSIVLDPVEITITLFADTSSHLDLCATVLNQGIDSTDTLVLRVESIEVELLLVEVNSSTVSSALTTVDRYTLVSIPLVPNLAPNASARVHLELMIADLQSESGLSLDGLHTHSDFSYYVRPIETYGNFTLNVVLPVSAILSQESVSPLFPRAVDNSTDGASMTFVWFTQVLQPGQERVFIVKYQLPVRSNVQTGFLFFELLLAGLICLPAGFVLGLSAPKIRARFREIRRIRFVGVTNEEEEVLEVIRRKGGRCSQKDLYVDLDMSQSKVSLILTNLEERGLVRRFREGRENIVHVLDE